MKFCATAYIRNTSEAVGFYLDAFGLTLGYHEKNPDGSYLHAALMQDGQEIFCVSEAQNDALVQMMLQSDIRDKRPTMSYGVTLDSEEAVRHAFAKLRQGGTVMLPIGALPWTACAAEVVDKYGVYWYLTV